MKSKLGYFLAFLIAAAYTYCLIVDWRECHRRGGLFLRSSFYMECVKVLEK